MSEETENIRRALFFVPFFEVAQSLITFLVTGNWKERIQVDFCIEKESKTKERKKEEEIERGDCGPPTRKIFL